MAQVPAEPAKAALPPSAPFWVGPNKQPVALRLPPIVNAALNNDMPSIRNMMNQKTDINTREQVSGLVVLTAAACGSSFFAVQPETREVGRSEMVKFLIQKGADVNSRDTRGRTAMHCVLDKDIAQLLIDGGADINARDKSGTLPLTLASEKNQWDIVRLLLLRNASMADAKAEKGHTALLLATYAGQWDIVGMMIQKGANADAQANKETVPAKVVTPQEKSKIIDMLIADVNSKDAIGRTPLMFTRSVDVAEILITKGADVNAKDFNDMTPLIHAVKSQDSAVVRILIRKGADVNTGIGSRGTPLMYAWQPEMVQILLENGANVNAKDFYGRTHLWHVAGDGTTDVAEILIQKGANVNEKDDNGQTPLIHAARGWHATMGVVYVQPKEMLHLLITKGADVNARDRNGRTALFFAQKFERPEIVQVLRDAGARD